MKLSSEQIEIKKKIELESIRNIINNAISEDITNGDVIKIMFPHIEIFEPNKYEIAIKQDLGWLAFKKEWWNAPYKENKE